MNIVQLRKNSLRDIPAKLRQLADEFDEKLESIPRTMLWVQYLENGEVIVGCFGDGPNKCEVVGMLHLAAQHFTPEEGDVSRGRL